MQLKFELNMMGHNDRPNHYDSFVMMKVSFSRLKGRATSATEKQIGSVGENDWKLSHGYKAGEERVC